MAVGYNRVDMLTSYEYDGPVCVYIYIYTCIVATYITRAKAEFAAGAYTHKYYI